MKPSKSEVVEAAGVLRSSGWLSETDADFQEALLSGAHWQWYAAGEAVSHGGDVSGGMFGLARGSVSGFPTLGAADAPILHIASAPFWYGANPLVSAAPRSMSAVARSACLVARVPHHLLASLLAADPACWRYVAQHVTEIVNLSQLIATDLLIRDTRRRCIAVLLRNAGCRTGNDVIATAEMTQDELAAMANLSRQTIGPILNGLAEAGFLSIGYRNIVVHDAAALRAIVAT